MDAVSKGDAALATSIINKLSKFYAVYIDELFTTDSGKTQAKEYMSVILSEVSAIVQSRYVTSSKYRLLAHG